MGSTKYVDTTHRIVDRGEAAGADHVDISLYLRCRTLVYAAEQYQATERRHSAAVPARRRGSEFATSTFLATAHPALFLARRKRDETSRTPPGVTRDNKEGGSTSQTRPRRISKRNGEIDAIRSFSTASLISARCGIDSEAYASRTSARCALGARFTPRPRY